MYGEKLFTGVGYPTPVSIPDETTCLTLRVPADAAWWGIVTGLLTTLMTEWQWRQLEGGLDVEVAAARWQEMVEDALEVAATTNTCEAPVTVPTPFWDEDTDVDDQAEPDEQTWYGYVSDLESPTTTFVEDVAIWAFTGFLAVAGAPAAAIAFHTVAPSFVVAIRRGDLGEVIRLYLDGEQAAEVDTSGYAEGEVIRVPLLGDPELSAHDMLLVRMS